MLRRRVTVAAAITSSSVVLACGVTPRRELDPIPPPVRAAEVPVLTTNVRIAPVPGGDRCPELPLPLVTAPEDREIALAVQEAFANDPRLRETDLGLIVADGVLLLRGRTSSAYEKQIAEQRARAVPGVREVLLDVFVGRVPAPGPYPCPSLTNNDQ